MANHSGGRRSDYLVNIFFWGWGGGGGEGGGGGFLDQKSFAIKLNIQYLIETKHMYM